MLVFLRILTQALFSIYTPFFGNLNYSFGLNYCPSTDDFQIYILNCKLFPYVQVCHANKYWTHHSTKRLLFYAPYFSMWHHILNPVDQTRNLKIILDPFFSLTTPFPTSNWSPRSVRTSVGHYHLLPLSLQSPTNWSPDIHIRPFPHKSSIL